jgi:hypothetical protein
MIRHRTGVRAVALCWLLTWAGPGFSAEPPPKPLKPPSKELKDEFLRLTLDGKKVPLALETAVVRCVPRDCGKTSPTVDLIAALHVADKAYYQELNRRFATYDVVLYELVAPKGTRVPAGGDGAKSGHPVSMIQSAFSRFLDLTFQLDAIDYTRSNLVHADMSPQQLAESMREGGESVWTIVLRMFVYAMSQEDSGSMSEARLLAALLNKNRALAMKRVVAEQFRDMEGSITALEGPKGSSLISGRNRVALKELRKAIDAGHRKIAIFYGGGHMPDFQRRLKDDFDLVPIETQWLVAWDLKQPQAAGPAKPAPKDGASGKPSGRTSPAAPPDRSGKP